MWAPLLGAIALAMLQPTRSEISHQQDEAVKQAVAAARIRMLRELPVTPVESGAWLNRLLQEMWVPFCQPFLLANNLNMWQVGVGRRLSCSSVSSSWYKLCLIFVIRRLLSRIRDYLS